VNKQTLVKYTSTYVINNYMFWSLLRPSSVCCYKNTEKKQTLISKLLIEIHLMIQWLPLVL